MFSQDQQRILYYFYIMYKDIWESLKGDRGKLHIFSKNSKETTKTTKQKVIVNKPKRKGKNKNVIANYDMSTGMS